MLDFGNAYHKPVMCRQSIEGLAIIPSGIYMDLTFGGGGHSRAILSYLNQEGKLYAFDQDIEAKTNSPIGDDRFVFCHSNFRYTLHFADYYGIKGRVNGILADLGVSSHHFDKEDRGFSFRSREEILDMRMNSALKRSAQDLLMTIDEEALANIFWQYGELKQSRRLAKLILQHRPTDETPYTVGLLLDAVKGVIHPREEKKQLGMLFQALRIEVNDELGALKEFLSSAYDILAPEGRILIMSYHSLEDRIVKQFFKNDAENEQYSSRDELIYGKRCSRWLAVEKMQTPSEEEIQINPRSRSARLRIYKALKNKH